jgi:uncharacterized alkaline shock family protein YloU
MAEHGTSKLGQIRIADEVISVIAGTAALESEGVAYMSGKLPGDIAEMFGKKNFARGVSVEMKGGDVVVGLNLYVRFGYRIQDVTPTVQSHVKNAIETMTGLNVLAVNVNVSGVVSNVTTDKNKHKTDGR